MGLSATSNEGLVSVDNAGTVRLWETGVANLQGRNTIHSFWYLVFVNVTNNL